MIMRAVIHETQIIESNHAVQYGEVVDVHLVRDGETGKSRGFCFLAYEDQRSTNLAVDNLSGSKVRTPLSKREGIRKF